MAIGGHDNFGTLARKRKSHEEQTFRSHAMMMIMTFCPVYIIITIALTMSCVIYSVRTSVTSHMMSINGA